MRYNRHCDRTCWCRCRSDRTCWYRSTYIRIGIIAEFDELQKGRCRTRLGKGLHRENWEGTMEIREDLPCCSKWSNLCFSMFNVFLVAVISAPREIFISSVIADCCSVLSFPISSFNFRISPSISSRVGIADCFLIFTDLSEFEVQEREIWLPKCEGNVKKQLLILLSQVKWYNYDQN